VDKFGEVILIGPMVIRPHTLNCAPIFEFLLPQNFLWVTPIFDLTYKVPPSLHHLAKFRGHRPKGLGDFALKPIAFKIVLGEAPKR